MCGITAFTGKSKASTFLIQGLEKLEYRGYDSAGIGILDNKISVFKKQGKLVNLKTLLNSEQLKGNTGIGHTRWATHGIPSDENSHPHLSQNGKIALVHNGIIENYDELKKPLVEKNIIFNSQTDSEVIVQLLEIYDRPNFLEALDEVTKLLIGSYALCVIHQDHPDLVFIAKKDSPIVIGQNEDCTFGASDIPAVLEYTKDVYFMEDHEFAILKPNEIIFYNQDLQVIHKNNKTIPYDQSTAQKNGYDSFMLKEIHDQPKAIQNTIRSRIDDKNEIHFEELASMKSIQEFNRVYFVACGTAFHACLNGAYIFEQIAHIPTICKVASEFRYDNPIIDEKTLVIACSQSGETADTLGALRLANENGATTIAIANVLGCTMSRVSDYTLYTHAGLEIAVASTKAYTTQVSLLLLLALYLNNKKDKVYNELIDGILELPNQVTTILKDIELFKEFSQLIENRNDAFYLGRGIDYTTMLEGALKIKEISYIQANAYYAGELKHGSIALIEDNSPVIALATQKHIKPKTFSNIQETISRGAKVILFTTKGETMSDCEHTYILPDNHPILQSLLAVVPLQCLAYFVSSAKGLDVDQPRNLAKSVTVE